MHCPQADRRRQQIKIIDNARGLLQNKAVYLEESREKSVKLGHEQKQKFK
jgi:hypothetical protein